MEIRNLELSGLKIITHNVFQDHRGQFQRFYSRREYKELGIDVEFVEDNLSVSKKGVIRGLHFQWDRPSTKLMRVALGKMYAVAVDIRVDSPTFGKYVGVELSEEVPESLYIPFGFATGICAMTDELRFTYKYTNPYNPGGESNIRFNDPDIGIAWPADTPIVSERDQNAQTFADWKKRPESQFFTMEASLRES